MPEINGKRLGTCPRSVTHKYESGASERSYCALQEGHESECYFGQCTWSSTRRGQPKIAIERCRYHQLHKGQHSFEVEWELRRQASSNTQRVEVYTFSNDWDGMF